MRTIGAITIGQTPRDDLLPEFRAALGVEARIEQRGALDSLSLEQIRELAPVAGDAVLVTRLRDGTEVKVAERGVVERLRACAEDLQGADLIVLWCTGELPPMGSRTLLLAPDRLLEHAVRAILTGGRLAVVVPSPDQIPALRRRWTRICGEVALDSVSPYTASEADLEATARRVGAGEPDLVVLDCIGFTERARVIFRRITRRPVLLPRSLLARVAGELIA